MVKIGNTIICRTHWKKIQGEMPTPSGFVWAKNHNQLTHVGGMSITYRENMKKYQQAFVTGKMVEFLSPTGDMIIIDHGGKTALMYHVTEKALREEEVTLEQYNEFVEWLKIIGEVEITGGEK